MTHDMSDEKILKRSRGARGELPKIMKTYSKAKAKRIADALVDGQYTLNDIMKREGITRSTYYRWRKVHPEFDKLIFKAEENRNKSIADDAPSLLAKQMRGYEHTYVENEYAIVNPTPDQLRLGVKPRKMLVKSVEKTKFIPASTQAIVFALTALSPEVWKHRNTSELTGAGGKDLMPTTPLSREACEAVLAALREGEKVELKPKADGKP